MKKYVPQQQGGYMLVEIMVSLMIFTLVAVASTGALLAIVDANAKSQTVKNVMDNLNVAVENMSRTIRIGTEYQCVTTYEDNSAGNPNCTSTGNSGIRFRPQDAVDDTDLITYYFCSGASVVGDECDSTEENAIIKHRPARDGRPAINTAITAPEVTITKVRFYVSGASTNDGQPRVFMIINGNAGGASAVGTSFNLQTTVSQREADSS
jgi:type II secretory pathway pseudopilin PulG